MGSRKMNLEHLTYVLGKLICRIRKRHYYGAKFRPPSHKRWLQSCVICGKHQEVAEPVKRKGGA